MATNKELEQQLAEMREMLMQAGIVPPAPARAPTEMTDYVPFGSDRHLAFLGLERVEDIEEGQRGGFTVYTSPDTQQVYRLADEMQAVQLMRPMDPDKGILLVLRQKVGAFESGQPQVPAGSPPLFGRGPNESIVEIQNVRV